MGAGGVNLKKNSLAFVIGGGGGVRGMLPLEILTGMSSKMAKNASKYVKRNVRLYY